MFHGKKEMNDFVCCSTFLKVNSQIIAKATQSPQIVFKCLNKQVNWSVSSINTNILYKFITNTMSKKFHKITITMPRGAIYYDYQVALQKVKIAIKTAYI